MPLSFLETEDFARAVKVCVERALRGRPVAAKTVAEVEFASLDDSQWWPAMEALVQTLMRLDGRNAHRWGMNAKQGSRFCQWRRGRMEHLAD